MPVKRAARGGDLAWVTGVSAVAVTLMALDGLPDPNGRIAEVLGPPTRRDGETGLWNRVLLPGMEAGWCRTEYLTVIDEKRKTHTANPHGKPPRQK